MAEHQHGAGLQKKIGPLPMWAWGLIAGVVGYYLYKRYTENTAATTSSATGVLDPNAIDPNTGLTYGQEENAALNQAATSAGGNGGSSGSSPTQSGLTGTQELSDFEGFISSMQAAGLWPDGGGGTSTTPAPPPATPTAPPSTPNIYVTVPSAPASTPSAAPTTNPNTAPLAPPSAPAALSPTQLASALLTSAGVAGAQAQTYLSGLLGGGYKKVAGTTQSGGLQTTGTYTRAGGPTYYVWGTSTTGLHIRQATGGSSTTGTINAPGQPTPAGGFRP